MAKKITPPIPLDHWYGDKAAVDELGEILKSPSFQKAGAVLKEIAGPSFNTLQDEHSNSVRHACYAGYRDAFNDLHKLSKIQTTQSTNPHSDEWTHIEK